MSLEQAINKNTEALNTLISLMQSAPNKVVSSEKALEVKEPVKEIEKELTEEDVRKSLIAVINATDQETAQNILRGFGVEILPDLKQSDYAACIEKCDETVTGSWS